MRDLILPEIGIELAITRLQVTGFSGMPSDLWIIVGKCQLYESCLNSKFKK